jgi:glucose 1-dehydrogenase
LNALLKNIPLARLGQPQDVANLVAFLASEEANYITGSTFVVDGGLLWNYQEQ